MLAVFVFAGIKWFEVTSIASLFVVMAGALIVALSIGLYLSIAKAKKEGTAIFDTTAKRFLVQFFIPLFVGGILCLIGIYLIFDLVKYPSSHETTNITKSMKCNGDIMLEPRLQEYLKKRKYYEIHFKRN